MAGVLWGLLGAVLIGTSDCIARVTSARVTVSVLISYIMALSVVVLLVWMLVSAQWPAWHWRGWLLSLISGVLNIVVLVLLYKALLRGPVAVASPAASTFAVLLVGFNVAAGEPWAWPQIVSVAIVVVGVLMLARRSEAVDQGTHYDAAWLKITAALGVAAALSIATRMFLAQEASAILGPIEALFLNRLFALLTGAVWILWQLNQGAVFALPQGRTQGLVALQAVLETAAFCAFLIGSASGGRVGAAIGFAAFAAAATIMARLWLREKIGGYRSVWIAVIATGVLMAVLGAP